MPAKPGVVVSWKATTVWTKLFGSFKPPRLPIVGPPMIGGSGGNWAAALHRHGGVGFIAAGHLQSLEPLEAQIALFRRHTSSDAPLCLGFVGHSATANDVAAWKRYEQVLDKHRPELVQFFAPHVTHHPEAPETTNVCLAHNYGAKVLAQVGNLATAQHAYELAGVDGLIVQGTEAGGHGLRPPLGRALLPLLHDVRKMVTSDYPVVAAGGIGTGAGVVAALAAGADAVALGTRLWATREALGNAALKQALVRATVDSPIRSTVWDQIQNTYVESPWPYPYDSLGALQNQVSRTWTGFSGDADLQHTLGQDDNEIVADYRHAMAQGDAAKACTHAGQGVGAVQSVDASVGDILEKIETEMAMAVETVSGLIVERTTTSI